MLDAAAVLATAAAGLIAGGVIGVCWPTNGPDDLGYDRLVYGLAGALAGETVGFLVGALLFA